nr:hypothetical protein GCM10020185_46380 [Pseudomonas brassicacearum subsp. brassicacearum]
MSSLNQALRAALDQRQELLGQLHQQGTDCYRLFHGSQEGAPGLTIDRYGPQLLVQSFHQSLERDDLLQLHGIVNEELGLETLLVYNDRARGNSRVDRQDTVYQADEAALQDLVGHEWGLNYRVRGRHAGQDPLLFLDLRNARGWVKAHSRNKSVLNLFAYTCGVGLSAAAGGAREVCNLDFAEGNLAVGRENGLLNPDLPPMEFVQSDYFPAIRQLAGLPISQRRGQKLPSYVRLEQRQYDLVLLDPPAWAKSAFGTVDLLRDYQSLLKPALLTTADNGVLICCNNLAKVPMDDWREQVLRCAEKGRTPGTRVERADARQRFPLPGPAATAQDFGAPALSHTQNSYSKKTDKSHKSQWLRNRKRMPYSKAFRIHTKMKPHMPKGLIRAIGALLTALALYSLLGFLILPGIALRIANQQLATLATVPAQIQRIELNPFSLEVTLWGLNIGEPGKEQVGFERLYANLQLDSLWSGALHLVDIELDKPKTEVMFAKDGQLNLLGLFKLPASEPTPADPEAKPFPLRVDRIKLAGGYVHFQDLRPSEPIEFLYDTLDFELKNLSTLPDDNADMTLVAAGPEGGQIDWTGNFSLTPIASQGTLKVTGGQMKAWWPYVRDAVPLVLEKRCPEPQHRLQAQPGQGHRTAAQQRRGQCRALRHQGTRWPSTGEARTPGRKRNHGRPGQAASYRGQDPQPEAGNLGRSRGRRAAGLAKKLFASQPAKPQVKAEPTSAPAAADSPKAEPAPPSKPWQVMLKDVQLRDYKVHLADRQAQPAVALEVGPLNLDLQNYDTLNGSPFTLKLDTGIGKQGKILADGEVNLNPITAKLKVKTQDVDLRVAQSYINPFIRLELRSGMLGSDLAVDLKSTEPLAFAVTGRAQVDQLHTLDTLKTRDFLKWQSLVLEGLNYQHGDSLSIDKVNLFQPYARFMINDDRTTNVDDLLIPQPADSGTKNTAAKPASQEKNRWVSTSVVSPSMTVRPTSPTSA